MDGIHGCVKCWYANARRQLRAFDLAARGRSVFIALVLVLTLGSVYQTPPAQAAPASKTEYAYSVVASKDKGNATICVGDNVLISVKVERLRMEDNVIVLPYQLTSGIWVEGSVQNPSIGKLIMARILTGWNSDQPGIAVFAFHADKPGKTTLTFKAEIHYYVTRLYKWLYGKAQISESEPVDVKVEVCHYKVTATSRWSQFGIDYIAIIDQAGMTADAPGHYTGTAAVNWVITDAPANPCHHVVTATSQADLNGDMDADGQQMVVDLAYQPMKATWYGYMDFDCTQKNWEELILDSPAPLTFSIPGSGGGHKLSQALVDISAAYPMSGSADVVVTPVTNH